MSESKQKVHFIAIGDNSMHHLALSLTKLGIQVTGSDVEIPESVKISLSQAGILPGTEWCPDKITPELNAVVINYRVAPDNPELKKAKELGLKIYSFPELVYNYSIDKQRIVITGSYGKTSIASIVLHVLKYHNRKFDYIIGEPVEGFETTVKLTENAPIIIIDTEETSSSPLDPKPQFLNYQHHIALINSVSWSNNGTASSAAEYNKLYETFADATPKCGTIIYSEEDSTAKEISKKPRKDVSVFGYEPHKSDVKGDVTYLSTSFGKIPVSGFGKHYLNNISGAKTICSRIGITEENFYQAIKDYKGTSNLLKAVNKSDSTIVFKDSANTPAQIKATTQAVKKQFSKRDLVAVLDFAHHKGNTAKNFLSEFKNSLNDADLAVLYVNQNKIQEQQLQVPSEKELANGFNNSKLKVFTETEALKDFLLKITWKNKNLLLMSPENFNGLDIKELSDSIIKA
ncbi:MAG TPA: Mur ligase domain-containing protein [Cytophagaceae bacterium]